MHPGFVQKMNRFFFSSFILCRPSFFQYILKLQASSLRRKKKDFNNASIILRKTSKIMFLNYIISNKWNNIPFPVQMFIIYMMHWKKWCSFCMKLSFRVINLSRVKLAQFRPNVEGSSFLMWIILVHNPKNAGDSADYLELLTLEITHWRGSSPEHIRASNTTQSHHHP